MDEPVYAHQRARGGRHSGASHRLPARAQRCRSPRSSSARWRPRWPRARRMRSSGRRRRRRRRPPRPSRMASWPRSARSLRRCRATSRSSSAACRRAWRARTWCAPCTRPVARWLPVCCEGMVGGGLLVSAVADCPGGHAAGSLRMRTLSMYFCFQRSTTAGALDTPAAEHESHSVEC